jgi:hypothetical protein
MSFRVSVRDTKYWDKRVRNRLPLELTDECKLNSSIIAQIIPLARPALTRFGVTQDEIKYLADSVAYLLRTDLIKANMDLYFQVSPPDERVPVFYGENGNEIRLLHKSSEIKSGFELKDTGLYEKLHNSGAEWFRCYSATIHEGKFTDKLTDDGNSFTPSFVLADVTAYLLDPTQIIDYTYTAEEEEKFQEGLERDFESM